MFADSVIGTLFDVVLAVVDLLFMISDNTDGSIPYLLNLKMFSYITRFNALQFIGIWVKSCVSLFELVNVLVEQLILVRVLDVAENVLLAFILISKSKGR